MAIYFNSALGFNLPPYWLQNKEVVRRADGQDIAAEELPLVPDVDSDVESSALLGVPHFDEVMIKLDDEPDSAWWSLPLDPVVSVTGKNTIVRRHAMKPGSENRRGTVKELWSQDDYEVQIAGVFMGDDALPEDDLLKLRRYLEARKTLAIDSCLLGYFGITRIAIEDYSLPFTKGIQNQMYTIKGYSDDMFDLLITD